MLYIFVFNYLIHSFFRMKTLVFNIANDTFYTCWFLKYMILKFCVSSIFNCSFLGLYDVVHIRKFNISANCHHHMYVFFAVDPNQKKCVTFIYKKIRHASKREGFKIISHIYIKWWKKMVCLAFNLSLLYICFLNKLNIGIKRWQTKQRNKTAYLYKSKCLK